MNSNPIEEIQQIRHQLERQADFSVSRIFADLHNQRLSSEREYLEPSVPRATKNADSQSTHRSGLPGNSN